jgi:N-acetyl-D-muramate 6-phosphate phosphatase
MLIPQLPLPRAVLFDLDGTLADTAPDLAAAVNLMRTQRGLAPTPYEKLRPLASAGARGLIGIALNKTPADTGYDALRTEFLDNYAAQIADQSTLFNEVPELLQQLEQQQILWGIVTNKPALYTDALIPLIGLAHASCIVSGDTTAHAKPHPDPLIAGMPTIAAAWGYCGNTEPQSWNADYIANTPNDLLTLLQHALA